MQRTWAAFEAFPFLVWADHLPSVELRIDSWAVAAAAVVVAVGLGTFGPFGCGAAKRQSGGLSRRNETKD